MIIHPLAIVILASRNDIAYISTFHCVISMVYHKLIGLIQMAFVVTYRSRSFVMHHQFHSLAMSIVVQHLHIKIRIWSHKIKDIILRFAEPVFPTFIPTFDKYLIKSMLSCEINVFLHILIGSTMASVRLQRRIVCLTQLHRRQIVCISPGTLTCNHLPPNAHIFNRFNPRYIFISTRLVQVQRDT